MASRAMRTSVIATMLLERVLDCNHFAAFVVAALRTNAVRHLGLMTLRTGRERLLIEEVVGAARARASSGMAPFWIRHGVAPCRFFWSAAKCAALIRVYCSCFFANSSRIPANAPQRSSTTAD